MGGQGPLQSGTRLTDRAACGWMQLAALLHVVAVSVLMVALATAGDPGS